MTDMHIKDDMIVAALDAHVWIMLGVKPGEMDRDGEEWHTARAAMGLALADALDVAPTVDGWVWCELDGLDAAPCGPTSVCVRGFCAGPHRTLIVGPEVTP